MFENSNKEIIRIISSPWREFKKESSNEQYHYIAAIIRSLNCVKILKINKVSFNSITKIASKNRLEFINPMEYDLHILKNQDKLIFSAPRIEKLSYEDLILKKHFEINFKDNPKKISTS